MTVRLYKVKEAGDQLGLSRSALYRLIKEGRVPYTVDPVGRYRFTDAQIAEILERGQRQAVA